MGNPGAYTIAVNGKSYQELASFHEAVRKAYEMWKERKQAVDILRVGNLVASIASDGHVTLSPWAAEWLWA
jgi:hypothetical protein